MHARRMGCTLAWSPRRPTVGLAVDSVSHYSGLQWHWTTVSYGHLHFLPSLYHAVISGVSTFGWLLSNCHCLADEMRFDRVLLLLIASVASDSCQTVCGQGFCSAVTVGTVPKALRSTGINPRDARWRPLGHAAAWSHF